MLAEEKDIAWAAGFYEGEGWIHVNKGVTKAGAPTSFALHLRIGQKDRWSLDRWTEIVKGGVVTEWKGHPSHMWLWRCQKSTEVIRIVMMIRPYLSPRRRSQIDRAIAEYYARPQRAPRQIQLFKEAL